MPIGTKPGFASGWSAGLRRYACLEDVVDYVLNRCGSIDRYPGWDVIACRMELGDERALTYPPSPLAFGSQGKPSIQGIEIDLENEDAIEQANKSPKVAGSAAEERGWPSVISDPDAELIDVPNMMSVREAVERLTSSRVALISEIPVAVDRIIPASQQLVANGGLAGAGNAFDQIIPYAHQKDLSRSGYVGRLAVGGDDA